MSRIPVPDTSFSSRSSPKPGSHADSDVFDTRRRKNRQDEAIRKKLEGELARKRPNKHQTSTRKHHSSRKTPGTVSALKPLPALTVPSSISIYDASQLCAAKRTDCVLVVDQNEHLCGIFTAKDIAYRVVGGDLKPPSTLVSDIMTPNPMVTRDSTSATEALQTMVERRFRHLPVCNDEGDVVGLLDITKVFHESLEKLERAYGSSQKLYSALEGVQSEWGGSTANNSASLLSYVQELRERMAFPDLGSILDARTSAATVGVKTTVREAAKVMRDNRTTAVIVQEENGRIAGIFTSKDIVLRVIAAGLDARTCSVVRVMTPHPDVALPSMSIQDALRKMHDGRFLNLPVVSEDGQLIGCVDVLRLTHATLDQMNAIGGENNIEPSSGPVWTKFFTSLGNASQDGDTESVFSESHANQSINQSLNSPGYDLHPNDSASMIIDNDESQHPGHSHSPIPHEMPAVVDDGTYLFKFLAPSGITHRFQARYDNYDLVHEIVSGKLSSDPYFVKKKNRHSHKKPLRGDTDMPDSPTPASGETDTLLGGDDEHDEDEDLSPDPTSFSLFYTDDDGDFVFMSSDRDVTDAVAVVKKQGKDRVVLTLRGGNGWEDAMKEYEEKAAGAKSRHGGGDEKSKSTPSKVKSDVKHQSSSKANNDDLLFGVLPKDLALPAAITFLGVSIIGIFVLSRSSSH